MGRKGRCHAAEGLRVQQQEERYFSPASVKTNVTQEQNTDEAAAGLWVSENVPSTFVRLK